MAAIVGGIAVALGSRPPPPISSPPGSGGGTGSDGSQADVGVETDGSRPSQTGIGVETDGGGGTAGIGSGGGTRASRADVGVGTGGSRTSQTGIGRAPSHHRIPPPVVVVVVGDGSGRPRTSGGGTDSGEGSSGIRTSRDHDDSVLGGTPRDSVSRGKGRYDDTQSSTSSSPASSPYDTGDLGSRPPSQNDGPSDAIPGPEQDTDTDQERAAREEAARLRARMAELASMQRKLESAEYASLQPDIQRKIALEEELKFLKASLEKEATTDRDRVRELETLNSQNDMALKKYRALQIYSEGDMQKGGAGRDDFKLLRDTFAQIEQVENPPELLKYKDDVSTRKAIKADGGLREIYENKTITLRKKMADLTPRATPPSHDQKIAAIKEKIRVITIDLNRSREALMKNTLVKNHLPTATLGMTVEKRLDHALEQIDLRYRRPTPPRVSKNAFDILYRAVGGSHKLPLTADSGIMSDEEYTLWQMREIELSMRQALAKRAAALYEIAKLVHPQKRLKGH